MEDIKKKTQIKILEMKTTISEMKNILDGIDSRLDIKLEGTATETIQTIQNTLRKRISQNEKNIS